MHTFEKNVSAMQHIAFCGLGVMGTPMLHHLLSTSLYKISIYTRTLPADKALELRSRGVTVCSTIQEAVKDADCVMSMVGMPCDVEEIYFGPRGILENVKKGCCLVDFTTSRPGLARRIALEAKHRELVALDAPVSGGDVGAKNATLVMMVGGEQDEFKKVEHVLRTFGTPSWMGKAGAGQFCKMGNQINIAGTMMGLMESVLFAQAAGLDVEQFLGVIGKGAAASRSLDLYGPRVLKGDYAPGFYVKHFVKDLGIALESAKEMNLMLPSLALAEQLYISLKAQGHENKGTQALLLTLAKFSNREAAFHA